MHAFYRFARNADDIADSPVLSADEKIRRLDRMAAILDGDPGGAPGSDSPAAAAMRASLAETGLTAQHCHDVLRAFRQDAVKLRYRDWDDLMEYCRYSAAPVGRQLLDLHGEGRHTWPASDALCAALQVLNHLQDCAADYRDLDRVYIPLSDLIGRRLHGRGARRACRQPGAAPRPRSAARQYRGADRDRIGPAACGSRRADCAGNRRSSSPLPAGWRGGCGAAIRWRAAWRCRRAISRPRS